jgi:hypothetical protein
MNEVKEIEIDSTFRNRSAFPLQTYFELPVNSFHDPSNIFSAVDPVSEALPRFSFQSFVLDPLVSPSPIILGVVVSKNSDRIVASFPKLFQTENYYRGLSTSTGFNIVSYKYNGVDSLLNDVGEFHIPHNTYAIGNPIQISWTSSQNFSVPGLKTWFVPAFDGQFFKYLYNERTNTEANIIAVYASTSHVDFSVTDTTWLTTDFFSLRNSLPIAVTTSTAPSTASTIQLVPGVKFADNSFVFVEGVYVGKLKSLSPTGLATVTPTIDTPIVVGSIVQILPFRENFQSLIYIGSQLSQTENKTYLVELVSLVLPNVATLTGPRVSSFPYLYVEFLDTNCPPHQNIMSNNPNSNKIFFRVTPSRIQQIRNWLSFDCDGSSKTLRFRPTATNFRFSVKTPDGVLLLLPTDNQTPTPPNASFQVSALLNVRINDETIDFKLPKRSLQQSF